MHPDFPLHTNPRRPPVWTKVDRFWTSIISAGRDISSMGARSGRSILRKSRSHHCYKLLIYKQLLKFEDQYTPKNTPKLQSLPRMGLIARKPGGTAGRVGEGVAGSLRLDGVFR